MRSFGNLARDAAVTNLSVGRSVSNIIVTETVMGTVRVENGNKTVENGNGTVTKKSLLPFDWFNFFVMILPLFLFCGL